MKSALRILSPAGSRARLMIFSFHRVVEAHDPLSHSEPDGVLFRRMLEWISDMCRVLPLAEATEALQTERLPARAAAITFDDGYRNNLTIAKPLLNAAGLPATVFIAVNAVRDGIMWNDLVIEALRQGQRDVDLQDLGLPPFRCGEDRVLAIEKMIGALKYHAPAERWDICVELYRRLAGGEPPRLMMTEDQLAEIEGDGIELGAHTMSHPILMKVPDPIARDEIEESRNWLRERTGRPPRLFAYPNGQPGTDYDGRHVAMVRDAGFSAAVSTRWGAATASSSVFELPRFTPWERDRVPFATRLIKVCAKSYFESKSSLGQKLNGYGG